jgi:hypothetical protein
MRSKVERLQERRRTSADSIERRSPMTVDDGAWLVALLVLALVALAVDDPAQDALKRWATALRKKVCR